MKLMNLTNQITIWIWRAFIRPPDIGLGVGGLVFFSFSSFFLFCQLPAKLAEQNLTISGHMVGSKCDLKCMSEMWGIPSPYKLGVRAQNHFFTISQHKGKFNRLCLRNETPHAVHLKRASASQTSKRSSRSSQNDTNFDPQTASNWRWVFTHPPYILHSTSSPGCADGDQQMELNQTLPNSGR